MKKVLLTLLCLAALAGTATAQGYNRGFGGYRTRFVTPFAGTSSFYGNAGLVGGCSYGTAYQPVVPTLAAVINPPVVATALAAPAGTSCGCGGQTAILPATVGYSGAYGGIGTAFYGTGYRSGFFAFRGGRGRR